MVQTVETRPDLQVFVDRLDFTDPAERDPQSEAYVDAMRTLLAAPYSTTQACLLYSSMRVDLVTRYADYLSQLAGMDVSWDVAHIDLLLAAYRNGWAPWHPRERYGAG